MAHIRNWKLFSKLKVIINLRLIYLFRTVVLISLILGKDTIQDICVDSKSIILMYSAISNETFSFSYFIFHATEERRNI